MVNQLLAQEVKKCLCLTRKFRSSFLLNLFWENRKCSVSNCYFFYSISLHNEKFDIQKAIRSSEFNTLYNCRLQQNC